MPRTLICIFLLIPLTVAVVHSVSGQSAAAEGVPEAPVAEFVYEATTTPNLSARAFYALDVESEEALAEHAANEPLPIASITKLITSALFFATHSKASTDQELITVTPADVAGMGRAGALEPGEQYPLSVLNFPALLTSANSASALMARSGEGRLIDEVNEYAAAHGFAATKLADAHGLSPYNVSTAAELAAWFMHISDVTPTIRDITRLKQYIHDGNGWYNNNPFITDPRYQGGKHGYTEAAGRTVLASFLEPVADGPDREIIYVILGSANLTADMATLRQHIQANARYR